MVAHPLVTVVGAAGCGKTRLAVEVARAVAPEFADGVWGVDLTAAQGDDQVVPTITSTLGLSVPNAGTSADALRSFTRGRRMLLMLDNCEHVLDAAAELVDDLLVDGTELAVLCTSREPLDVDQEVVWDLTPLPLPVEDGPGDPRERLRDSPALELFLERLAAAAQDTTREDSERLELAVRICQAVDGLPLAIELAAARARAFSLEEIAQQVTADPSMLARVGRGPADHHRTVRFAVEQSYRLLSPEEAALHSAVSVLPGPFTPGIAAALTPPPHRGVHARHAPRGAPAPGRVAGPGPARRAVTVHPAGHRARARRARRRERDGRAVAAP